MRVLSVTHPVFALHDNGVGHPERPDRLEAALAGVAAAPVEAIRLSAPEIDRALLHLVHEPGYVDHIEAFCLAGGGSLDPDTKAVEASWDAALRSAGAGPAAVEALRAGEADTAFLTVRPPGHHARPATAMGFCLFNNIAVTARMLTQRGERVAIVDWDVHHGNGTEEMLAGDGDVFYVSLHQYPFYPGTGWLVDMTQGEAGATTMDFPVPAGTAGDAYRLAFDDVIVPVLRRFAPDWVLVSAGYDAHAMDPLAELRLLPSDYAAMTIAIRRLVDPSRTIFFLEGGYDLDAIRASVAATLTACAGEPVSDEEVRWNSPTEAFAVVEAVAEQSAAVWQDT